ncbi:MAG: TrkA C-terminal domain-containing protein [Actinomycetota bacterium]|nr:TrkA C-terminal domain-containing protein [Actinomycetota bacterium]
MVAVSTVLVALTLSLLITRIASTALTITGLPRHVARFQARSAFTGVGFTTSEAEDVVHHPVRRRIVMLLMLLGNAGIITIAGSLILSFARSESSAEASLRLGLLVAGMAVLLWLANSSKFDRYLSAGISKLLSRWTDLEAKDYAGLLQLSGAYGISELQIQEGDWLADRTLAELELRDEGAAVLGIYRPGEAYVAVPNGESRLMPGDVAVIYGRSSLLKELDRRRAGPDGDREHEEAVAGQARVLQEQAEQDRESPGDGEGAPATNSERRHPRTRRRRPSQRHRRT